MFQVSRVRLLQVVMFAAALLLFASSVRSQDWDTVHEMAADNQTMSYGDTFVSGCGCGVSKCQQESAHGMRHLGCGFAQRFTRGCGQSCGSQCGSGCCGVYGYSSYGCAGIHGKANLWSSSCHHRCHSNPWSGHCGNSECCDHVGYARCQSGYNPCFRKRYWWGAGHCGQNCCAQISCGCESQSSCVGGCDQIEPFDNHSIHQFDVHGPRNDRFDVEPSPNQRVPREEIPLEDELLPESSPSDRHDEPSEFEPIDPVTPLQEIVPELNRDADADNLTHIPPVPKSLPQLTSFRFPWRQDSTH